MFHIKLLIGLSLLFTLEYVSSAALNVNATKPSYEELERQNLQLIVQVGQLQKTIADSKIENGQLQKTIADLNIENANLKLSVLDINNKLSVELNLNYANCTDLSREAEIITAHLKTLSEDVHSFNSLINKKVADYESKFGATKNITQEEIVPECKPNRLSDLKFVNQALCEKVCDVHKSNGEWTVIQRRMDGSVNFYRSWADYKAGFGTMSGEFFIGLDNLHLLTTCASQELRIELEDFDNQKRYAVYDLFKIEGESEKYRMIELGSYTGDAGDSLTRHRSQNFSTFDQDNENDPRNCARDRKGAWWYDGCCDSNLNGEYGNNNWTEGIMWYHWHGDSYSLKNVEMKIRPKN